MIFRIVHFIVKDTLPSSTGLHDLFFQGQTEHSNETALISFLLCGAPSERKFRIAYIREYCFGRDMIRKG